MYDEWNDIPLLGNITELPLQNVRIRAKKLCHITHNQPAGEIDRKDQEYFEFKPAPNMGRAAGQETYTICQSIDQATPPTGKTKYQRVTSDEELFPGYYSWWSIDYDNDHALTDLKDYYCFSDLFTSSSRYGNNKFSGNIAELLQCYQKAFDKLPRIQFRCGGTLRYKQEIRKVVIVCTDEHPLPKDKFPVMWDGHLVKEADEITLTITTSIENLEVVIRNGITGAKGDPQDTLYSWDTYTFGFYFPAATYRLQCPRYQSVIRRSEVKYIKRQHKKTDGKKFEICPNALSLLDKK